MCSSANQMMTHTAILLALVSIFRANCYSSGNEWGLIMECILFCCWITLLDVACIDAVFSAGRWEVTADPIVHASLGYMSLIRLFSFNSYLFITYPREIDFAVTEFQNRLWFANVVATSWFHFRVHKFCLLISVLIFSSCKLSRRVLV